MDNPLSDSLLDNYTRSLTVLRQTIGAFDEERWIKGISFFQVPAKVAYHIIDCLDYYFRPDTAAQYQWGHRFGGGWWDLPDDGQPSRDELLQYLEAVRTRIVQHFAGLSDVDLVSPYDEGKEHGETRLGHYVYALRHTMHHHGELTLLAILHGGQSAGWE